MATTRLGGARIDLTGQSASLEKAMAKASKAFDKQERDLKRLRKQAQRANKAYAGLGKAAGALTGLVGIGAAGATLKRAVADAEQFSTALVEGSRNTGLLATELEAISAILEQDGIGFKATTVALSTMQKRIAEAEDGLATSVRAFDKLGLSWQQLRELSPRDQFITIVEALARVEDQYVKSQAAQDIFGRGGKLLPGIADRLAGSWDEWIRVQDAATKTTDEQYAAIKNLTGAVTEMERQQRDAANQLIAANQDAYLQFLQLLNDIQLATIKGAAWIGKYTEGVKRLWALLPSLPGGGGDGEGEGAIVIPGLQAMQREAARMEDRLDSLRSRPSWLRTDAFEEKIAREQRELDLLYADIRLAESQIDRIRAELQESPDASITKPGDSGTLTLPPRSARDDGRMTAEESYTEFIKEQINIRYEAQAAAWEKEAAEREKLNAQRMEAESRYAQWLEETEQRSFDAQMQRIQEEQQALEGFLNSIQVQVGNFEATWKSLVNVLIQELLKLFIIGESKALTALASLFGFGGGNPWGGAVPGPHHGAQGGLFPAGRARIVGETGPELEFPAYQTRVIPWQQLAGAGGGGSVTVNVYGAGDKQATRAAVLEAVPAILDAMEGQMQEKMLYPNAQRRSIALGARRG